MPLLPLPDLAEHVRNIRFDSRIGLLSEATAGRADPLPGTGARVPVRVERTTEARRRDRFPRRHTGAALYAGFRDFAFCRVAVEQARPAAVFGRIRWVESTDIPLFPAAASSLAQREADILACMDEDHADATDLCATALPGRVGDGWTMVGMDPEGCDPRRGSDPARLDLGHPVTDARSMRGEPVGPVGEARRREERPPVPGSHYRAGAPQKAA